MTFPAMITMARSKPPADRSRLLDHAPTLFRIAQTVTADPARAAHLVEATYRRALAYGTPPAEEANQRTWLLRLLVDVQREHEGLIERGGHSFDGMHAYHRTVAERLLDTALPVVYATLPPRQRLVLMLREVEGHDVQETATFLRTDTATAETLHREARAALRRGILDATQPAHRRLLHAHLPETWLRDGLERLTAEAFEPIPPTLRATLDALAEAPGTPARTTERRDRSFRRTRLGARARRAVVAILLILTAGLVGYLVSDAFEQEPDLDLITLSARQAEDLTPALRTDQPAEAERFLRERLDWRLTLPTIDGAQLQGVAVTQVTDGVEVPVLLYKDTLTGSALAIYVYTYALLDTYSDRIELASDILLQIAEPGDYDLWDLGRQKVLIWRYQDEIFVAVTRADAETLRERITFPS